MTNKEKLLVSHLLKMASDEFSNHGCNDMDQRIIKSVGFTTAEKIEIAKDFYVWNKSDHEVIDWLEEFEYIGDSSFMDYMAHKMIHEVKDVE